MTVHAQGGAQYHHCATPPFASACPTAPLGLQPQGIGTERLEELLAARFGDYPVLRIDRGSTRRRDAGETAGRARRPGRDPGGHADAGQGHDLAGLTLVAVVGSTKACSADFGPRRSLPSC